MGIDFVDLTDLTSSKLLRNLKQYDIIRFESDRIADELYVVFNIKKDIEAAMIVIELWQLDGGYDHRFHRFLEQDVGLNIAVPVFQPIKHNAIIKEIINYRTTSGLTDKEEFFFDMIPDTVVQDKNDKFRFPYELIVEINDEDHKIVATQWTPLQKIPVEKLIVGASIEVWEHDNIFTMMKLIKL